MDQITPQLRTEFALLKDSPTDKGGSLVAITRSRAHKLIEGQKHNTMTAAFRLDDIERAALAAGADLYVSQVTYGDPAHDVRIHIGAEAAAKYFALDAATPLDVERELNDAEDELASAARNYADCLVSLQIAQQDSKDTALPRRRLDTALKAMGKALETLGRAKLAAGITD